MYDVIKKLSFLGIKLNITAIMTEKQIKSLLKNLNPKVENYISIFCRRADTGRDPVPLIKTRKLIKKKKILKFFGQAQKYLIYFKLIRSNVILLLFLQDF